MLPKQAIAFPEVAIIRKGTPKRKNPRKPEQWIQGMDLGGRFRIAFAPGTEDVRTAFQNLYPTSVKTYGPDFAEKDGFEMSRIRCMITTRSVSDAWEWANEAYSAGRLIARADDAHFITYRNPLTGEYEIQNGEPFREFKHGMNVEYERDGRKFTLPIRTYGRLSLFLPELGRMVRFTLKTTSFYDRLNISANLAAIQFLADTLNGGNAAGIPFFVYRREQEITWNKPDGGAQRIKKWLVNIEADPEWVTATMQRMSRFALGGDAIGQALLPPPVSGNVNPENAEDEATGEGPEWTLDGDPDEAMKGTMEKIIATAEPVKMPAEGTLLIGNKKLNDMTVDELSVLRDNPKASATIKQAARIVIDWKIERERKKDEFPF